MRRLNRNGFYCLSCVHPFLRNLLNEGHVIVLTDHNHNEVYMSPSSAQSGRNMTQVSLELAKKSNMMRSTRYDQHRDLSLAT
jgi:hypothetical protein